MSYYYVIGDISVEKIEAFSASKCIQTYTDVHGERIPGILKPGNFKWRKTDVDPTIDIQIGIPFFIVDSALTMYKCMASNYDDYHFLLVGTVLESDTLHDSHHVTMKMLIEDAENIDGYHTFRDIAL